MHKNFLVGKLFRIVPAKGKCTRELTSADGINYVAAKKTNNGIADRCSYVDAANKNIISDGNCIVFVQLGDGSAGYTTYQPKPFVGMNGKIACGYIDGILNEKIGLYLMATLDKNKQLFSYSASWTGKRLRNTVMSLPVKVDGSGNPVLDSTCKYSDDGFIPDFEYMQERIAELEQERIAELEQERIAELEQYLIATGLNDYELTDEDKEILATKLMDGGALQSSTSVNGCLKEARSFKLDELFGEPTRGTRLVKEYRIAGDIPLVTAGFNNQGVAECISNEEQTTFNCGLTIDMFGNCFYRDYKFKADDNILVFDLESIPKGAKLYIASAINKVINGLYSYSHQYRVKSFNNTIINLPTTTNGTPDWEYMEKYIKATEKVVIRDVVDWKDEIIEKTKEVVDYSDASQDVQSLDAQ